MSRLRLRAYPYPDVGPRTADKTGAAPVHIDQDLTGKVLLRQECTDDVGREIEHDLSIISDDNQYFRPMNGTQVRNASVTNVFKDYYPPTLLLGLSHLGTSIESTSASATRALARSNPNRADVSLPNFVYELKDLPGMYRDIMGFKTRLKKLSAASSASEVANFHLATQFGWLPLISDLRKISQFQSLTDKRVKELERLMSNKGLKRRVRYPDWKITATAQSNVFLESAISSTYVSRESRETRLDRWATVRWIPTDLPNKYTSDELRRLARRLVFGINRGISAEQAWKAIPWTWMIDWFTNVGDFLGAHSNGVPVTHGNVSVMTHIVTQQSLVRTDTLTGIVGGDGVRYHETKQRSIHAGASLAAHIPFIGKWKLSILGALAIQRLRGGRH